MNKATLDKLLMQNILHNIDIGIHVIDNDRKTIVYNEAMAKLEGLEKEQVINRDLLEVFPSLNEKTSTLIRVLSTKKPIIDKVQTYINFKGKKIFSLNSTIPIFYKGKIVGALEITKDITYLKELSERLMDLQHEFMDNNDSKLEKGKRINRYTFKDIIGKDEKMANAIKIAKKACNSHSSVLIYGETGTGKELFAQSIHYGSNRKNKPFIAQNCASIPESLLEGILFGTEKGGFTGAVEREGIFEQANGGTLLLDEINSMPYELQAKLLRVLQEGYIRRVGGIKDIPVDVRIIATINEDPLASINNGTLRKDLYYRLNVININIPPLRERKKDIELLANYFINKYNYLLDRDILGLDAEVMEIFYNYSWPGNVRELENTIEAAMNYISYNKGYLHKEDIIASSNAFSKIFNVRCAESDIEVNIDKPLPDYIGEVERNIIEKYLKENGYNVSKTAKKLGIKRQTLQHKLKKYEIIAK